MAGIMILAWIVGIPLALLLLASTIKTLASMAEVAEKYREIESEEITRRKLRR